MYADHHHTVSIVDFERVNDKSVFVEVAGYDAEKGREFEGIVKFLDGMLYGDLVHNQRSTLSSSCRSLVRSKLLNDYQEGKFN
ncbi:hypothetical protein [Pseudobacillus wudalianchiensis]|uniref:DUF3870 domain-containing protein n=1 Tax=Pseudobacillus wudalianchiensis TaxID=1743143 RepID=A0A1B9AU58_9BACI|nr:hypothetical protein [Bacillus wudalianchiensis]OCA87301.1 hypothetical protein A8F95_08620 [Bacillus wudalianchiensis]